MNDNLTPTQAAVLARVRERGYLTGITGSGPRLATMRRLEALGLITLDTETHNDWYGGTRTTNRRYVTEWTARPV